MDASTEEKVQRVNPWLAIWLQTRKALVYAWKYIPEEYIHRNFILVGLLFMLALRVPDWLAITPNPIGVMIQVLLVGPVGGIVAGYLYSAILRMVGKWLGQSVPSVYAKCAVAWSDFPFAMAWAVFILVCYLLNGHQTAVHPDQIWLFRDFLGWLPLIAASPLLVWGIVVRIRAIGVLFGFTPGKASVAWLLTILLAYVPAAGLIVTYGILYFVTASGAI
ncbi:MAG TPA: hypothetical protein VHS96_03170 [Bacteroidia bacterium]|jgi:hypothetical protein|nr:hypothetical protein [Bacteroidia bacterium]